MLDVAGTGRFTGNLGSAATISSGGQIRATGWYSSAQDTALAFEIGIGGTTAYGISYNRGNSTYGPMEFDATQIAFRPNGGVSTLGGLIDVTGRFTHSTNATDGLYLNTTQVNPQMLFQSNGTTVGYVQFSTTDAYFWNSTSGTGFKIQNSDKQPYYYTGSAYVLDWNAQNLTKLSQLTNDVGYVTNSQVTGNFNGPIYATYFYDYSNNAYYLQPSANSYLYYLTLVGGIATNKNGDSTSFGNGVSLWTTIAGTTSNMMFKAVGTYGTHGGVNSDYATYFVMDTGSRGWIFRYATSTSAGTNVFSIQNNTGNTVIGTTIAATYQLNVNGSAYAVTDMRAPYFYDSSNTSYYAKPAGTSIFSGLTVSNTITGSITGNAGGYSTALYDSGFGASVTRSQLFNNQGYNHTTYQSFSGPAGYGFYFVHQDSAVTDGPGGLYQYYVMNQGLGNDYAYSSYAMQTAINRYGYGNPYLNIRFKENGTWTGWGKIYAGYADTSNYANSAGTITGGGSASGNLTITGNLYVGGNMYDNANTTYYLKASGESVINSLYGYGVIGNPSATYTTQAAFVSNWSGAGWWGLGSNGGHLIRLDQVGTSWGSPTWSGATDVGLALGPYTVLTGQAAYHSYVYAYGNTGYYMNPAGYNSFTYNGIRFGPNPSWSAQFHIGGNGIDQGSGIAQIAATNGNLHYESASASYGAYINYYRNGPIYVGGTVYDSQNTAYYLIPRSTSVLSAVQFGASKTVSNGGNGNLQVQSSQGDTGILGIGSGGQFGYQLYGNGGGSYGFLNGNWASWDIQKVTNGVMYLNNNTSYYLNPPSTSVFYYITTAAGATHQANAYSNNGSALAINNASTYWGLVTNLSANAWYLGYGNTTSYVGWNLHWDNGSTVWANGAMQSPIYYDSANTGYYIVPRSDSYISTVHANNWFRAQGGTGLYSESYGHGLWWPENQGGSYGNVSTYSGGRSGWQGYNVDASFTLMGRGGTDIGLYDQSWGWLVYWTYNSGNSNFGTSGNNGYRIFSTGSIYAQGNVYATSDSRYKKNIVTIDNALNKVKQLRGVYYEKVENEDLEGNPQVKRTMRQLGLIAQEVNEVVPELVTYNEETDMYGLSYANTVGLLIEAIKEQQNEIDDLKEMVRKLINGNN